MNAKAMSLKAKIRNRANKMNMSAQVVLQNYMFERFLERLSKSEYKDMFILKGGMLIAAIVGISNRATMDMDTTIRNYPLNEESISKAIDDICSIPLEDDVMFSVTGMEAIRDDDSYGGFRVNLESNYDTIITPMHIDITTGDAITPSEIYYDFQMIFNEGTIGIWAYNIETILAKKFETILRRSEFSTRPRDFYDIYILVKTQMFDDDIFKDAVWKTSSNRGSTHIFVDIKKRIITIENSKTLKNQWNKYTRNYNYAKDISYDDVIGKLKILSSEFNQV